MKKTFDNYKNANNKLRFESFMKFEGIQKMISEELLSAADLEQIWKRCVDRDLKPADFGEFLKVNDGIQDLFGESKDAVDDPEDFENPWNPNRPIALRFVGNTVEFIRQYFDSVATTHEENIQPRHVDFVETVGHSDPSDLEDEREEAGEKGKIKYINFRSFADWDEVSDVLEAGDLEPHFVKDVWQEALEYKFRDAPFAEHLQDSEHSVLSEEMLTFIAGKELYACTDPLYSIDFDTFLRLNYRLDEIVEDTINAPERRIEERYQAMFTKEFKKVTSHHRLMTWEQLLNWDIMQEMLENKAITVDELRELWQVVPKDYIPKDDVQRFAPNDKTGTPAINVKSFIAINNEIQSNLRPDEDEEDIEVPEPEMEAP